MSTYSFQDKNPSDFPADCQFLSYLAVIGELAHHLDCQKYVEHKGEGAFDIPFMIRNHESMKKILGAI